VVVASGLGMLSAEEEEDEDELERRDSRRLRRNWKAVEDMVDEVGDVILGLGREMWDVR